MIRILSMTSFHCLIHWISDSTSSCMKTKKEWRAHFQSQRLTLTMEEREYKSKQLTDRYLSLFEQELPAVVHLFLPMTSKAEVDTWMILKILNEKFPSVKTVTSV